MKRAAIAVLLSLSAVGSAAADGKQEFLGHDALALSNRKEVITDCKVTWEDAATKKIYCFSSDKSKEEFAKDTAGNLAKAEAFYKTLPVRKQTEAEKKIEQTAAATKKAAEEQKKVIETAEKAPKEPVAAAKPAPTAKVEVKGEKSIPTPPPAHATPITAPSSSASPVSSVKPVPAPTK